MEDNSLQKLLNSDWYKERPIIIKEAINSYPPTVLYRFKDSKKQCYIIGYTEEEDNSVTLIVQKTGKGGVMDEMGLSHLDTNQVFGVSPNDLETIV